jgi:hypothetical protein
MWKQSIITICLAMLLGPTGNAAASVVITTADGRGADTYLANDGQSSAYGPTTTHGADTSLRAFRQYANTRSKAAYIRFDLGDAVGDMSGAILTFELTYQKGGGGAVNVYGLIDGDGDSWDESTTSYNTAPGVIPNPPTALGNCVLDMTKMTLLGTITVPATPTTYPVQFSSNPTNLPLADFLEADTNKLVTFIFLGDSSNEGEVASKEQGTFDPPTLTLPNAVRGARTSAICLNPANGAEDVPRDDVLSWTPGVFAATHNVYFGTDFEAVTDGDASVLVGPGQDANTYDPPGHMAFDTTYYWRIDEVNAPPSSTVYPGKVWSFTVEPFARPIETITATASSTGPKGSPQNTVNGVGLNADDQHSTLDDDMWVSNMAGPQPTWIMYEFDRVYKMYQMLVWNYNISMEMVIGVGFKDVAVEYSEDGVNWASLADQVFARGTSSDDYAYNTTVDFGGVAAKYVKLTPKSNWGGLITQYGLSEVRFFYIPVAASAPSPASAATDVDPRNLTLSWRPGREAASHEVYLATDVNAVTDSTVPAAPVSQAKYAPANLQVATTYYWKVVEVNQAESTAAWSSEVWDFTTLQYLTIDDFESYTNDSPNRVFQTWIDGLGFSPDEFFPSGNPGNGTGAIIGNDPQQGDIMETANALGRQAMPMTYDNSSTKVSEAQRTWTTAQNWTTNGADTLRLYFLGTPIGFLELSPTHILMNGIGTDIFATDQGRFVYKQLSGDGSIIARVERIDETDPWAKACVMIRRSLDATAPWAMAVYAPGNGFRFQTRATVGGAGASDTAVATAEQIAVRAPVWIKIERVGNAFNAYYATADAPNTWIASPWGAQTIEMTDPIYIGLAVTSHSATAVTQAEFSNITTTSSVTGQWQSVDLGIEQPAGNVSDPLYVRLEDTGGHKATVVNPDPMAVAVGVWTPWEIPLTEFSSRGVKTDSIMKMTIGVGDDTKAASGTTGVIYIDDIGCGRRTQ